VKQLTNVNRLTDEYLKLSYQGARTKDHSSSALLQTNFEVNTSGFFGLDHGDVSLELEGNKLVAFLVLPCLVANNLDHFALFLGNTIKWKTEHPGAIRHSTTERGSTGTAGPLRAYTRKHHGKRRGTLSNIYSRY
jgi:hypothetical protein